MITIGIDIGSITTKGILLRNDSIAASQLIFTGYNAEKAGESVFNKLLSISGTEESSINCIVSTGYGRKSFKKSDKSITEITCHGAGAHFTNPRVRFVIDVGGQDSKAILLNEKGNVVNFVMNDKCAAGTGRFLEVMARALEIDIEEFSILPSQSDKTLEISSICTVFAESEVITLISKGEKRENIISGIFEAAATRISSMAKNIGITSPVMMTGGVAKNAGMVRALAERLNTTIEVTDNAQFNGAIGAAILAKSIEQ
ncbi:acyl-CoA dehydratase activase [Spirochaetota bacterium]